MARLKRVFSSGDQVLHLWANQSQADARSANVFFEGLSCYSYGSHYELGRLHLFKGKTVAVINRTRYSNTTSKHQAWAFSAVEHLIRLYSSDVSDIKKGLLETQGNLIENLFNHFCARKFWYEIGDKYDSTLNTIKEFNNLCDLLEQKQLKLDIDSDFIDLMNEHIKNAKQKQTVNDVKRAEKMKIKAIVQLREWKQGGQLTQAVRNIPIQLIRIVGDVVQTSRGAEVPLYHAKRLLTKVLNNSLKTGEKIGAFTVDSILINPDKTNGRVIKIGCHTIDIEDAKIVLGAA